MSTGIWDTITKVCEFDRLQFVDIAHCLQPFILKTYVKWS